MSDKANREFRKIPSLEYRYEVNEDGTIIRNVKSKKCLKCYKESHNSNTEYWVTRILIKGHNKKVRLHQVVAECWLGPKPEGYEVDHIDRNSLNNHYSNLRYVTKSEQMLNRNYDSWEDTWMQNLGWCNGFKVRPIRLIKDGIVQDFPSARKAAKYLCTIYPNSTEKSLNNKFYHNRSHIFDCDVIYLNEETVHGDQ